jgi:hypothetical protein
MVVLPTAGEVKLVLGLPLENLALPHAKGRTDRIQIAVATRQKSTARRLVSICAVRDCTNQMLFS